MTAAIACCAPAPHVTRRSRESRLSAATSWVVLGRFGMPLPPCLSAMARENGVTRLLPGTACASRCCRRRSSENTSSNSCSLAQRTSPRKKFRVYPEASLQPIPNTFPTILLSDIWWCLGRLCLVCSRVPTIRVNGKAAYWCFLHLPLSVASQKGGEACFCNVRFSSFL